MNQNIFILKLLIFSILNCDFSLTSGPSLNPETYKMIRFSRPVSGVFIISGGNSFYNVDIMCLFTCVVRSRPGLRLACVVVVLRLLLLVTFFIGPNPL
jgi:hypothetical protein